MWAKVCVLLNVSMFNVMLLLTQSYILMIAYILTCIFPLSVVGKGWDKGRECDKGRVGEDWEMDCFN